MTKPTSSYVKSKLEKVKNGMDEVKFLLSNSYRGFLQKNVTGITGRYDLKVIFSNGVYTNNKVISINPVHPFVMSLKDLSEKTLYILGQLAHEIFHILYTDFGTLVDMDKRYKSEGPFRFKIMHSCMNIIEDSAIELAGINYYTGTFKQGIIAGNKTALDLMPSLDDMAAQGQPRIAIFQQACAMYCILGTMKGKLQDQEMINLFKKAMPIMDDGRLAPNSWGRLAAAEKLYALMLPLIEEAEQQRKQDQANQSYKYTKNEQISSSGQSGQTQEQPETQEDFQKQNKKQTQKEIQEQEDAQSSKQQKRSNQSAGGNEEEDQQFSGSGESEEEDSKESDDDSKGFGKKSDDESKDESDDASGSGDESDDKVEDDSKDDFKRSSDGSESDALDSKSDSQDDSQSQNKADSSNGKEDDSELEQTNDPNAKNSVNESEDENGNPQTPEKDDAEAEAEKQKAMEELKDALDNLSDQLGDVKEDAAKEEYDRLEQAKQDKAITEFAKNMTYATLHNHIRVEVARKFDVDDGIKNVYNYEFDKVKSLARNLIKNLKDIIKYNEDQKTTGLFEGKVNKNQLSRLDKKVFFQRKDKSDEADLVFTVLVDMSGSMSGDRIMYARLACMLLKEVCDALGIPIAIIGHTAKSGSNTVYHFHFCDFDSRDVNEKYKLAHMNAYENTREGVSLKYAGEYLLKRPETDKYLIAISDGGPYHSSTRDIYGGDTAQKDTGRVVKELEGKGVKIFGCAIGDGKSTIKQIYTHNYMDIPHINQLPTKLIGLIQKNLFK